MEHEIDGSLGQQHPQALQYICSALPMIYIYIEACLQRFRLDEAKFKQNNSSAFAFQLALNKMKMYFFLNGRDSLCITVSDY